jgi:hypothetical protein
MDEVAGGVKIHSHGRLTAFRECDAVVGASTVDVDEPTRLEIKDVPADRPCLNVDRMIVFEILVGSPGGGVEIGEEASFPRCVFEPIERFPSGVTPVGGRLVGLNAVGMRVGPIPALRKIEVDFTPLWVPSGEVAFERRGDDNANVEPGCEHGDGRECADASSAVGEIGPGWAIEREGDRSGSRVELAVERDWSLCECAKPGVDRAAAGADCMNCVA